MRASPPRPVETPDGVGCTVESESIDRRPLVHGRLAGPSPASTRLRRFFDPAKGWFRSLERRLGHILCRDVYSRIPGISLPYSAYLDRRLTVSEATVQLNGLAAGFEGTKLLLITDIHVGPFLKPETLEHAFARLLSLRPDLVLLGGDLVSARLEEFSPFASAFRLLKAPLGVFAVLGNHEHYAGEPERLRRLLEETGVRLLHNAAVSLERGGGTLILAGVDDLHSGDPDLEGALAEAKALAQSGSRPPVILLSHNPDLFFEAAGRGVSLVLSGHTHGGQVRIPGLPVLVRMSRYRLDEGRYTADGAELVVSRGLGATGLPLRWNCPPEAVLLELRGRPSHPTDEPEGLRLE